MTICFSDRADTTMDELTIRFEKPEDWPSLPPKDELHELSHFEFAMQRYFFHNNYRISLKVGSFAQNLHLFPDIALALKFLPVVVRALVQGKPVELTFPESWLNLRFSPHDGQLNCKLQKFGTKPSEHFVVLARDRTVHELKNFLEEILKRAVATGYVSSEEANELTRELPQLS